MKSCRLAIVVSSLVFGLACRSLGQNEVKDSKEIVGSLQKAPSGEKTRSFAPKGDGTRRWNVAAPAQISTQAILFKFGKTDFEGEQSYDQLKELGKALMDPRLKDASIQIEGHTDNVGPADFNQKLSEARAKKIVDELRQHYDLVVKELLPVGKGKLEPAAGSVDQQTDAERAQNRRVVIKRVE
jgi:outer membrane protein OmpA-like peptidoglycan-associated protein